ncbi:Histone deacetylase domain [Nesidiocoris tenuis]|uniref:Histone deacetylase domain n=1 Tax=Nesidiocoris tenuis TaxID=355587 RepID=A0ABN7AG83_9HEMI|nr:Histone deacetylase domain [Nesidiocoris tenuis]
MKDSKEAEDTSSKWPFVYSEAYNVRLWGLEKLHPFDARKWGNIFQHLKSKINIDENRIFLPTEASKEELLHVHTERYLRSLKWGCNVAKIAEIPWLVFVPNMIIQRCYLRPMRYQTNGTIVAGKLAMERGWSINIGGGFHHCSKDEGGGFCPYADITLLIQYILETYSERAKKVMVVDLDAHQGNGYEKDFKGNKKVFILDVYNRNIYPQDKDAKEAISCKVELQHYTVDYEYLDEVERSLERSLSSFHPDLIVYNAGTDILDGDPLGRLSVSPKGVIKRDQIVFMKARERAVPIVMLTSGGYLKESAKVIADSIVNLHDLGNEDKEVVTTDD